MSFDLEVPAGSYNVKVSALGVENISQLGVGRLQENHIYMKLTLTAMV